MAENSDILREIKTKLNSLEQNILCKWLNVKQTAQYLSCSESKVRQLINEGRLIPKRIDNQDRSGIRFSRKQLDLYMITGKSEGFTKRDREKAEVY